MPLPAAAVNWKWVKAAVKVAEYAIPAGWAYLDSLLADSGDGDPVEWRRFVIRCTRSSPSGTSEDLAQFKLDLVNLTGGVLDTSWTSGDYAAVKARLDTMLTALKPYTASVCNYSEYRAYAMAFNATPDVARPFVNTGPPAYLVAGVGAGTGVSVLPYQVSASVTFRTAWPKHWGRVYMPLPWLSGGLTDSFGRLNSGYRTAVANAWHTCLAGLADDGFLSVTPVGQVGQEPYHALLATTDVVIDDIPDVIRTRRPRQVAARTIGA